MGHLNPDDVTMFNKLIYSDIYSSSDEVYFTAKILLLFFYVHYCKQNTIKIDILCLYK